MPCIFNNKEDCNLTDDCQEGGERHAGLKSEVNGHWMKQPGRLSQSGCGSTADSTDQIWGSSTVKWESSTSFAHFHCSWRVGTFCCTLLNFDRSEGEAAHILDLVFVEVRNRIDEDPG